MHGRENGEVIVQISDTRRGGVVYLGWTSPSFQGLLGIGELLRERGLSCILLVGVGDVVDR